MNNLIEKAVEIIRDSSNLIALTGAGISVESGIPDFRSSGGLWEKYDPAIYATIESFHRMPEKVWDMIFDMTELVVHAHPNPGHKALAELEEMGYLRSVITQNIDNLHQDAGSKNVIEYHGNAKRLECLKCGRDYGIDEYELTDREIPKCIDCKSILKPTVVFFGEMIPHRALYESQFLAESADAVIVAGTSAVVYPAASIPLIAKSKGARIIEVNIEETDLSKNISDVVILGQAGKTLPDIIALLKSSL